MMVLVWVLVHPLPLSVPETLWAAFLGASWLLYIEPKCYIKKNKSAKTMCFLRFSTAIIQPKTKKNHQISKHV